ncbi:MAG: right-handed parallel beta-helix repeat-containing protein [Bacteroidales bacterium]|nr:right-handed parallel beta-helix repeat-containing protein [Bacteroidales bacterium]
MRQIVLSLLLILLLIGVASAGEEGAINAALQANAGGTYTLTAGEHTVDGQIIVPPNTSLTGTVTSDGTLQSKIILGRSFCLAAQEPIIRINSGCTVSYINFDGNSANRDGVPTWKGHDGKGSAKKWGQGYDNFIGCKNVEKVRVHHCNFDNNLGDSFRIFTSKNIEFDHNSASKGGHDVFFAVRSEGVSVHDNYIQPRVNSAIRLMDVTHAWVFNNVVRYVRTYDGTPYDAGPDIQIQHDSGQMKDVTVCYNTFIDSCGPGLWLVGKTSGNEELNFHHNVFYRAGSNRGIIWVGGVIASGYDNALFENNVFDGSYLGGINFYATQAGWATSATATVNKCILIDAVPGTYNNVGGYGIYNSIDAQNVQCTNSVFYNNAAGDSKGAVTITGRVSDNPRVSANPTDFTWDSSKSLWVCPGLDVSSLNISIVTGGDYDNLPELTQEEIDEFEFMNIFSILDVQYSSDLNLTTVMPKNYKPEKTVNVIVYNNTYMPQSRYNVKTDNYTTKVEYKFNNTTSTHFLQTKFKASGLSGYDNIDMWELKGGATRLDNLFVVPGVMTDAQNPVKITVYDTGGHKTVIKNYNIKTYQEDLTDAINPVALFLVAILFIIFCGIALNLKVLVKKWNFLKL